MFRLCPDVVETLIIKLNLRKQTEMFLIICNLKVISVYMAIADKIKTLKL